MLIKLFANDPLSLKFQVMNTALMTAQIGKDFQTLRADSKLWGRLIESVVGAHLINSVKGKNIEIFYWCEGNYEVDFILKTTDYLTANEVKKQQQKRTFIKIRKI